VVPWAWTPDQYSSNLIKFEIAVRRSEQDDEAFSGQRHDLAREFHVVVFRRTPIPAKAYLIRCAISRLPRVLEEQA
jgi:hypothetical protein